MRIGASTAAIYTYDDERHRTGCIVLKRCNSTLGYDTDSAPKLCVRRHSKPTNYFWILCWFDYDSLTSGTSGISTPSNVEKSRERRIRPLAKVVSFSTVNRTGSGSEIPDIEKMSSSR